MSAHGAESNSPQSSEHGCTSGSSTPVPYQRRLIGFFMPTEGAVVDELLDRQRVERSQADVEGGERVNAFGRFYSPKATKRYR